MVNNLDRAQWASSALQTFAEITLGGYISSEALCDLICDIGHFAELELKLSRSEVVELYSTGIGAWSAESRQPLEEPDFNDRVSIQLCERCR